MYKRGHDYDYQYDWVLKKQGKPIPEDDFAGQPKAGNIGAVQGKEADVPPKPNVNRFVEERKENRANVGAQVMNGFGGNARQASATKRRPSG
jgi:hypothetical protein